MPERIQLRRTKGWRKPEGAVVVARPSRWGNPWRIIPVTDHRFPFGRAADVAHIDGDRHAGRFERASAPYWATQMYKLHLREAPGLLAAAKAELRDRDLACWCPLTDERGDRVPCHADILLDWVKGE